MTKKKEPSKKASTRKEGKVTILARDAEKKHALALAAAEKAKAAHVRYIADDEARKKSVSEYETAKNALNEEVRNLA